MDSDKAGVRFSKVRHLSARSGPPEGGDRASFNPKVPSPPHDLLGKLWVTSRPLLQRGHQPHPARQRTHRRRTEAADERGGTWSVFPKGTQLRPLLSQGSNLGYGLPYHRGPFSLTNQQVTLPVPVDPKSARTELNDGLLRVVLKIKQIPIEQGDKPQ